MSLPFFIRSIDTNVAVALIWVISVVGFLLLNSGFFSTHKSKGKKIAEQTESTFKKLDFDKRSKSLALTKQWSEYLNRFPLFKLTPEKRSSLIDKLRIYNQEKMTDITVEELHVQKWKLFIGLVAVTLLLSVSVGKFALLFLLLTFLIDGLVENKLIKFTRIDFEDFDTEFYNFYCVFISQYNRLGTKVDLNSVLQNFSDICSEDMIGFCTYFRIDLGRGPDYALRELRSRYSKNQEVQEFCTLAEMVTNGNQQAKVMADTLLGKMERKAKEKREKELEKLKKSITTQMTVVLIFDFALIFILFIKSMF